MRTEYGLLISHLFDAIRHTEHDTNDFCSAAQIGETMRRMIILDEDPGITVEVAMKSYEDYIKQCKVPEFNVNNMDEIIMEIKEECKLPECDRDMGNIATGIEAVNEYVMLASAMIHLGEMTEDEGIAIGLHISDEMDKLAPKLVPLWNSGYVRCNKLGPDNDALCLDSAWQPLADLSDRSMQDYLNISRMLGQI